MSKNSQGYGRIEVYQGGGPDMPYKINFLIKKVFEKDFASFTSGGQELLYSGFYSIKTT